MKELTGIINDPNAPAQSIDEQYDVMLSLADKGHTLLLVGEDMLGSDNELLQKLELSGMFKVHFERSRLDRIKQNQVKCSFLPSTKSQGPRDKWGKVK